MERIVGIFLVGLLMGFCTEKQNPQQHSNSLFREVPSIESGVHFTNQIQENEEQNFLRYPYFYNGGGVALGDINNDGLTDIYFTGNTVGDHLYLNRGNLRFEEVTQKHGILKANLWTTGVTMADINNDGWLDIYVCRSGSGSFRHNLLYINQGNGKFIEQAKAYGLNDTGYSVQANFFDYDLDGDLDVYLVNHSVRFFSGQEQLFEAKNNPHPSEADRLYRNNGTTATSDHPFFEEVSEEAGINHFAFGLSASIADLNLDGLPDIYVASDFFEPDFLYINQGDGHFVNQINDMMGHISFSSMGSDISDFNNDGLPDVMVCDMQAADNYRKKANMASMDTDRFARMVQEGYHFQYMQNTLQLNSGMGRFSEIAELAGVSETDWSWGPLFCDLDNDGWKDLFISNGIRRDIQYKDILNDIGKKVYDPKTIKTMDLIEKFPVERLRNYTYQNKGNLQFINKSEIWGIDFKGFSTGAAYGDLDNDGDLDIVLNNLENVASVYENLGEFQKSGNYLQVSLHGEFDNHFGFGSKITLDLGDQTQYQYVQGTRGFQSSVPPRVHFGLGNFTTVDKIIIQWPNGSNSIMENVAANQHLVIRQEGAALKNKEVEAPRMFSEITETTGLDFNHKEIKYDDFLKEVLLPHQYSQQGPALAVGDVNNDHLDDIYIGGAYRQAGQLFIQTPEGSFSPISQSSFQPDHLAEDVDAIFFDADNDNDLDLYVVSGSNEWQQGDERYLDRLYFNNGRGQFKQRANSLPPLKISGSCVRASDIDADGDLDLFVGGRGQPGNYPLPGDSYFLENEGGNFTDATSKVVGESFRPGMVTDARWLDFDNDRDKDLVVVGEWMPISLYQNTSGILRKFEADGLANSSGWWYSLASEDMDQDGDIDLIAGNLGLNYKYRASISEPFQVYASDFDENGNLDIVLGYFNDGELYPLRGRQCSSEQMPSLTDKFQNYSEFASATLEEVYGRQALEQALHLKAQTFASAFIENLGDGKFSIQDLPIAAQLSSVNGILIDDLNNDHIFDLILAGNMYGSEVETARNDASLGVVLLGQEGKNFSPLPTLQSGFKAAGNVKGLAKLSGAFNQLMIIAANNNDKIQVWEKNDALLK